MVNILSYPEEFTLKIYPYYFLLGLSIILYFIFRQKYRKIQAMHRFIQQHGFKLEGEIIAKDTGIFYDALVCSYEYEGKQYNYIYKVTGSNFDKYQVGNTIDIRLHPREPHKTILLGSNPYIFVKYITHILFYLNILFIIIIIMLFVFQFLVRYVI